MSLHENTPISLGINFAFKHSAIPITTTTTRGCGREASSADDFCLGLMGNCGGTGQDRTIGDELPQLATRSFFQSSRGHLRDVCQSNKLGQIRIPQ